MYYDPFWNLSTLASARVFESKAAAQRVIDDKLDGGRSQHVIVNIHMRLSDIAYVHPGCTNLGRLNQALATVERDTIQAALDKADMHQLRASLQQRESAPKKRM